MDAYKGDFDDDGIFVVLIEGGEQGPIVMETEGQFTSRGEAERIAGVHKSRGLRTCIARLTFSSGNPLLFKQTKDMQG